MIVFLVFLWALFSGHPWVAFFLLLGMIDE